MFNSGSVRRQIGLIKKRILQQIELTQQLLSDYDVHTKSPVFTPLSDEELTNFHQDLTDARLQLLNLYSKTQLLHDDWSSARKTDQKEEQIYHEYIQKYGDYSTAVQEAVTMLDNIDVILNAVDNEFVHRQLSPPRGEKQYSHTPHDTGHKPREMSMPTTVTSQRKDTQATETMNFVDASILSRLDLPTFDGNLLEYPEFHARFNALIGSKTQLDDTTKFSLLKSCLRGRALQSIQGLSLTAHNYHIALDILKSRYDDKVTTRHILFSQLANLPSCDQEGRHLQTLYNKMYSLTRQFCSYEHDSKEIALGAILMNKLPRHVRSRIYDTTGNAHNLTPSELLRVLTDIVHKEATLQEIDFHCKRPGQQFDDAYAAFDQQHKKMKPKATTRSQPHSRDVMSSTTTKKPMLAVDRRYLQRCSFCDSNQHSSFRCDKFGTPQLRIKVAKERRLCFNCLSIAHRTKECPSKRRCQHCSRLHHTSLCLRSLPSAPKPGSKTSINTGLLPKIPNHTHFADVSEVQPAQFTVPNNVEQPAELTASTNDPEGTPTTSILLMCAEITVFNPSNPSKIVRTLAFLDSGSSRSYITTELAHLLQLPDGEKEDIAMHTFGTLSPLQLSTTQHTIGIHTNKGSQILQVKALQTLVSDIKTVETDSFLHVQHFATTSRKPSLLIGADYFWELLLHEDFHIETLPDGYHLIHSSIGKILTGSKRFRIEKDHCYNSLVEENENLNRLVHRFWNLESEGITDTPHSSDDDECLKMFKETIYFDNNEHRYVVQLPFKGNKEELPNNYQLAYARLRHNIKNLNLRSGLVEKYHNIMKEQLTNGIIEEVKEDHLPRQCHYLPHHAVISEAKTTTKVRCVYDGSAKTKGNPSLNELLYRGPILLPDITGILLRIRLMYILVTSDIEKAFLMVGLDEESRDFTRFLWLKDPTRAISRDNIVTYRFRRVPFGLNVSPFLLAGTIHYHLTLSEDPLSKRILRNTYVDNIFYGAESEHEAKEFYTKSKRIFKDAGMNLRQYYSNSADVNNFLSTSENSEIPKNCKLLGILWNTSDDTLSIQLPRIPDNETQWTKRRVLKVVASAYDPLGWYSPALFSGKVFLQSLWKEQLEWDDILPPTLSEKWKTLISEWSTTTFTLPRRITGALPSPLEIHIFTDASIMGYCAVAYAVEASEERRTSLLMSKTRLSPLKSKMTIPRLELSALVLGSRLLKHVCNNLDLPTRKTTIWSDSCVALTWIKSGKDLPIFIRNRIKTLKENAHTAALRYVPSKENPADIGSRGVRTHDLQNCKLWWSGPEFLQRDEDQWPIDVTSDPVPKTYAAQEREIPPSNLSPPPTAIEAQRFSTWTRLHRTVHKVLLFLCKKLPRLNVLLGSTPTDLFDKARTILFRLAQHQNPPSAQLQQQLQLFIHDTLWKSRGRINNADLPADTICPVFLPRRNHITALFILHIHHENNHCGVNQTLCTLRRCVWIPKGRTTVKHVIHKLCFYCKRFTARPFKLPNFPPHPEKRVRKPNYPFENIGMDFAGPLQYKTENDTTSKYWILLITCLNTRAIYVDIVLSTSSQVLLQALRRFFATTAYPKWILCDNAKPFQVIDEVQFIIGRNIENHSPSCDIVDFCAQRKVKFKFIPSLSPWQGGLYEKMVHVFKISFKHALHNRLLQIDELRTLAKETETIVNSRPLTYVSADDRTMPLRPIDFTRPWAELLLPRFNDQETEWHTHTTTSTKAELIEQWKSTNSVLNRFWQRWSAEYLTSLREQFRITHPRRRCVNDTTPHEGDVVLIEDKTLDRGQWKMGQLLSSSDNFQRSACIRLPSNKVITRPVNMLYKLELEDQTKEASHQKRDDTPQDSSQRTIPRFHTSIMLSLAIALLSLISLVSADTRCPFEINTPKSLVYATNCMQRGIAIAKYKDTDTNKIRLCWFPVTCPIGSIRIPIPFKQNQGICGPKCPCPKWTSTCSFSSSSRRQLSKISNIPLHIASYLPEQVCSFTPSEKCDKRRKIDNFNQVQLFDDTLLVVRELHVAIKDYVNSEDFICFDSNGTQQTAATAYTGTSFFCNQNNCIEDANVFCTYGTPSAVFTTPDEKDSFLIKAWGVTTKTYYGHLYTEPTIQPLFAQCTKGGLQLHILSRTTAVEACVKNYCQFVTNPTNSTIIFPATIVAFRYTAEVSTWNEGKLTYNQELKCDASPICEIISCSLCFELIYNPHCWSKTQILLTVSVVIAIGITIGFFLPIVRLLSVIISISLLFCRHIIRKTFSSMTRTQRGLAVYTGHRRRLLLAIMLLQYDVTTPCSEVITLSANEETCDHNRPPSCTFNQATVLTLQPMSQEVCLLLKDSDNNAAGMLTIQVQGLHFRCKRRVEFYTRDHNFKSESVHRCRFAGSCSTGTCDNTKPTDKFPEFSTTANNRPGYTFCAASCGCLACGGCFFCLPSCLFYRFYASPESDVVYTVFNCPFWEFSLEAHVKLYHNGISEGTDIVLHPARSTRWNNVRLSLIASTTPQMPVLASTFITDGTTTALAKPASSGQLVPYTIGQLQCSSLEDARSFNCTFPINVCSCSPATNQAPCACSNGVIKEALRKSTLPLSTKHAVIFQKNGEIIAKMNVGTAVQLHLVTENLKISSSVTNTTCTVSVSELTGCYDCIAGAHFTLACTTEQGEASAEVQCGNQVQAAICNAKGHLNDITLHFSQSAVQENCSIACPGGSTSFDIVGELYYFNDGISLQQQDTNNNQIDIPFSLTYFSDIVHTAFTKVTSWITALSSWLSLIYMIIIFVAFAVIVRIINFCRELALLKKQS